MQLIRKSKTVSACVSDRHLLKAGYAQVIEIYSANIKGSLCLRNIYSPLTEAASLALAQPFDSDDAVVWSLSLNNALQSAIACSATLVASAKSLVP
jgi:hypothetical protein